MAPGQIEMKGALGRELAQVHFGQLYRAQGRAILAYVLRRVGDPEDAADVVAETFLIAWRRLDEIPTSDGTRLWLYAVARRVLANQHRARQRRTRLGERLAESLRTELATHPAPSGEAADVLRAMSELSDEDRELLLLVSWEELSPGEAARIGGGSKPGTRHGGSKMKTRGLEMALAKADPVDLDRLDRLDLEAMEAELLADLDDEQPAPAGSVADISSRRHPRRRALALGSATLATAVAVFVVLSGGGTDRPSRAYGAELVRFAESTPLLLLEGPGWRVQNANEYKSREGIEGSMEFVTGKPIPYESVRITGNSKAERESGMFPPAVRQRRVELSWRHDSLADAISNQRRHYLHPHGQRWVKLPVLDTTAEVDTRAEFYVNQGGPDNRQMIAFWPEDGYVLELKAAVPDQAAFEERLGWLGRVDSQTWLDAMPAKVVKAADHKAAVREMLKGIPVPSTFKPSRIPDEGLTTNRDQVGGQVTSTVSCLWFRQWAEARRTSNPGAEIEAEKAMATSKHWPVLRQMAKEGGQPPIWKLAAAMPSGMLKKGPHIWRLLPQAEALGCARLGLPLLPRKQKLQRERGIPLPPR